MKKFSRPKRFIFFPLIAIGFLFLISGIVMLLWNNILPVVFGVKVITFWQAMGILVLSKLLFGFGFKGRRPGWGGNFWQRKMQEKFANMTPEEREQFKDELRRRAADMKQFGCGPFGTWKQKTPGTNDTEAQQVQ